MLSEVLWFAILPKTCCPKFCGLLFAEDMLSDVLWLLFADDVLSDALYFAIRQRRVVLCFRVCHLPKTCCLMFCGLPFAKDDCVMFCGLPFAKDVLSNVLWFAISPNTCCLMFCGLPFANDKFCYVFWFAIRQRHVV